MYRCGKDETAADAPTQCNFALCGRHYRGSLRDHLVAVALGEIRAAIDGGGRRMATVAGLALGLAVYQPFVKTAIMVLSCHPFYQCTLGTCWAARTQLFVLSAYLALVVILFLGVGLPLVLFLLLRRRHRMMGDVFFAAEFRGRFGDAESRALGLSEWRMFVSSEPSALASMYSSFKFDRIYMSPVLIVWKVLLIAAPIFLEKNSFTQLAGCAAAEVLFGIFIFAARPPASYIVNGVYRLSSVHQVMLLGLVSLGQFRQFHQQSSLQLFVVGVTLLFLTVSLSVVVGSKVMPALSDHLRWRRMEALLRHVGIPYSETCPVVVFGTQTQMTLSNRAATAVSQPRAAQALPVELAATTEASRGVVPRPPQRVVKSETLVRIGRMKEATRKVEYLGRYS
jgi:hypothetical protein